MARQPNIACDIQTRRDSSPRMHLRTTTTIDPIHFMCLLSMAQHSTARTRYTYHGIHATLEHGSCVAVDHST